MMASGPPPLASARASQRCLAESFAFDESEIGGNTVLSEGVREPLLDIGGKGLAEGTGTCVGKHDGTPHRDPLTLLWNRDRLMGLPPWVLKRT